MEIPWCIQLLLQEGRGAPRVLWQSCQPHADVLLTLDISEGTMGLQGLNCACGWLAEVLLKLR